MIRSTKAFLALSLCAALVPGVALTATNAPVPRLPLSAGAPDIFAPYAQAEAYIGQAGTVVAAKGFVSVQALASSALSSARELTLRGCRWSQSNGPGRPVSLYSPSMIVPT